MGETWGKSGQVKVIVNPSKCKEIEKIIQKIKLKSDPIKKLNEAEKEKKAFHIFVVTAICHQINWDFILSTLEKIQENQPDKFNPEHLSKISNEELNSWLADYDKPWRIEIEQRAELLRDCAKNLMRFYDGKVMNLIAKSNGFLKGKNGLYNLLSKFKAYREDPLQKKSSVLIKFLYKWGLIEIKDPDNYIFPIDYHIARLNLRNGRILIQDGELRNKLINQVPVKLEEDIAIRSAVIEAYKIVYGNVDISRVLGDFDWTVGRDCCNRDNPVCEGNSCQRNRCTPSEWFEFTCKGKCPYEEVCKGSHNPEFIKLKEQKFISTLY